MLTLTDDDLLAYKQRIAGKVVVITGGAKGIGRQSALLFASQGARVVIGDLDTANGQATVSDIEAAGGKASFIKTNVTLWDDQVALFEHALQKYKSIDVVVANAGVAGQESEMVQIENGKPVAPPVLTIDVNIKGAYYTAHLSQHYLLLNRQDGDLKSIIVLGSMGSWMSIPSRELYTASKHAMLGLSRTMHQRLKFEGVRVACIHPWFADTDILNARSRLFLAGIPMTTVPRVAGAIFCAATDPKESTDGCSWMLADDGPVVVVEKEEFKHGVYRMIDERVNFTTRGVKGVTYWVRFMVDLWKALIRPQQRLITLLLIGGALWSRRSKIRHLAAGL